MNESPVTETVDSVTFELRPFHRKPTNPQWVCLRKSRPLVDRYCALATELQHCNMVEVGIDRGGSTAFFAKLYQPRQLLAIEKSQQPVHQLMAFLRKHKAEPRVKVCLGVDQGERAEVSQLVDDTFGRKALDIVVDDASHMLEPSTATFEVLFPKLRAGGVYFIEDWWGDHLVERGWTKELAANPNGKLATKLAKVLDANATIAEKGYRKPISVLICQLLIGSAFNPDWIAGVRVADGVCEIRRGSAEIPSGTPIASYIGTLGQKLFNTDLG